jgi:hypothetical protein
MDLVVYRDAIVHELGRVQMAEILGLKVSAITFSRPIVTASGLLARKSDTPFESEIAGAYSKVEGSLVVLPGMKTAAAEVAVAGVIAEMLAVGNARVEAIFGRLALEPKDRDREILTVALGGDTDAERKAIEDVLEFLTPHSEMLVFRAEALIPYLRHSNYGRHLWSDLYAFFETHPLLARSMRSIPSTNRRLELG